MAKNTPDRPQATSPQSLSGLKPFLRPYTGAIAAAGLFLLLAAAATLAFPWALRQLIDGGLATSAQGQAEGLAADFVMLLGWPWPYRCFQQRAFMW